MTALVIFFVSYLEIDMGRIPGLALDRVGIAVLGAIAMVVYGWVLSREAVSCIDFPTLCLVAWAGKQNCKFQVSARMGTR